MRDLNRSSTLSTRRASGSAPAANATPATPAATAAPAPAGSSEAALRSDALLQGRSYVNIVHNGETYQLRATRLGKLILTK